MYYLHTKFVYTVHDEIVCRCSVFTHRCALIRVTWWQRGRIQSCSSLEWTSPHCWRRRKRRNSSILLRTSSPGSELCHRTLCSHRPHLCTQSKMETSYRFVHHILCLSHPHPKTWCDIYFGTFWTPCLFTYWKLSELIPCCLIIWLHFSCV